MAMKIKVGRHERYTVWGWTGEEWKEYDLMKAKVVQSINKSTQVDLTIICDPVAIDRTALARGGKLAIACGSRLIDKVYIDDSAFKLDKTVEIVAFSSAGKYNNGRNLLKETVGEDTYIDSTGATLVSNIIDSSNILAIDANDTGGSSKTNFDVRYEKRIEALQNLCEQLDKEWWIEYPDLFLMPTSEGTDTLHVANAKGSSAESQITLRTSGDSSNAHFVSDKDTDLDRINHVRLIGAGSRFEIGAMDAEHYLASSKSTRLDGAIDTYANEDLDEIETTITVKDASVLLSSGWVQIDDEIIKYTGVNGNDLEGCTRAWNSTTAAPHLTGAEVMTQGTDGTDINLTVDSTTGFPSTGTLRVGAEVFTYTGTTSTTFTGCARGEGDHNAVALPKYTHGDNCPIYLYKSGSTWYHPTSPESGSTIATEGILADTFTDSQSKYRDDLDKKIDYLLTYYSSVENIEVQIDDPFNFLDDENIETGDLVTIIDSTTDLNGTYRIKELEHKITYGLVTLVAILSNERKLYSLGLKKGVSADVSAPTIKLQERISRWGTDDGANITIKAPGSGGVSKVKNIRELAGGSDYDFIIKQSNSGKSVSIESDAALKLQSDTQLTLRTGSTDRVYVKDGSLEPDGTSIDLGSASDYWDNVHYHTLVSHSPIMYEGNALKIIGDLHVNDKTKLPNYLKIQKDEGDDIGIDINNLLMLLLKSVQQLNDKVNRLDKGM